MSERVQKLADDLIGTCQSLGEACESAGFKPDDLSNDELAELDSLVLECERCNWWCETGDCDASQKSGDVACSDCREDEGESV